MDLKKFFSELKRRNVYKVAITYVIVAWLILQIGSVVFETIKTPDWVMQVLLFFVVIGFPIALILAWAFEMSPQGMIRTSSAASRVNPYEADKKKPFTSNLIIGILIFAIIGQFAYNKYWNTSDFVNENIEKSVAVLPFKNLSSNQENQFFCDGVMDAILNHLARIEGLYVPSRTTMEKYKESPLSMKDIAAELGVNYILEGSVQRNGNEVFIIAQLINGKTDNHIWVNEYQRDITEIFKVQAEVTKTIASELKTKILPKVEESIEAVPTSNMEAYDFHLKGWELTYKSYNSLDRQLAFQLRSSAYQMFKSAIALDSTFASPYGGLANLLFIKGNGGSGSNQNNILIDSALAYCNKGIRFDKNDPELFWIRARCYEVTNREDKAFEEYQKVISINPNNALSLQSLAEKYRKEGEYITAFKLLKRAFKGDRSTYHLGRTYRFLGKFYSSVGDLTKARESIEKTIELSAEERDYYFLAWTYWGQQEFEKAKNIVTSKFGPETGGYTHWSGMYHLYRGEYEEALKFTTKNRENKDVTNSHFLWILHGLALDGAGRSEEGHAILNKQLELLEEKIQFDNLNDWSLISAAGIYAYFDNTQKALEYLRRGTFIIRAEWNPINSIENDLLFKNLKEHPEFIKIMEDKKKEFKEIRDEIYRLESLGEL